MAPAAREFSVGSICVEAILSLLMHKYTKIGFAHILSIMFLSLVNPLMINLICDGGIIVSPKREKHNKYELKVIQNA